MMNFRKKIAFLILLCFFFLSTISMMAQQLRQKVGTNSKTIAATAALEVESTTLGFLPPRMKKAERDLIASPATGLMIWCTDCGTGELQLYNGSSWDGISAVNSGGSSPLQASGAAICDGTKSTVVAPITSSTGRIWMDRNLGASQAATSSTDYLAYGCLYQWGRGNDGHASINWTSANGGTVVNGTSNTLSTTDMPGNPLFITQENYPYDWRSDNNNTRWQTGTQINNPCPTGYNVPSPAEYRAEFDAYGITNAATGYASPLKLVLAGRRDYYNGVLTQLALVGHYWSNQASDSFGTYAFINASTSWTIRSGGYARANAYSVRCIKESAFAGAAFVSAVSAVSVIKTITAAYTATASDYTILCNTTNGGFTLTLPVASTNTSKVYTIRKTDETDNVLTFSLPIYISETTNFSTLNFNRTIVIQSNGFKWYQIN